MISIASEVFKKKYKNFHESTLGKPNPLLHTLLTGNLTHNPTRHANNFCMRFSYQAFMVYLKGYFGDYQLFQKALVKIPVYQYILLLF